jgi:transcriptional regulator with XRE-family HTH domain
MGVEKRLLLLINNLGITKKKFAESINLSPGNISDWLSIKRNSQPSLTALSRICETYGVNLNWLLTGEGSMYLDQGSGDSNKDRVREDRIRELENQISSLKKNISLLQAECNELSKKNQKLNSQLIKRLEELLATKDELLHALSSST